MDEIIDSLLSIPSIVTWLIGILVTLVAIQFDFLGKKEWFGNSCTRWVLMATIVAVVVLLLCGWYWFVPCVFLIPIGTVAVRWIWLKQCKKKMLKGKGTLDYDIKRYEYYEWLGEKELLRWEVKKFLLPAMNILFEIGVINKLDEKLEELSAYKDWYEWKRLKSYVHWNRHEYQKVIDLMKPYVENGKLEEGEQSRVLINIFGAYRNLEDQEGISVYVRKLEELFFEKKRYSVEAADDLMFYYDEHGEVDKIEKLKEIIRNLNFKTYASLLDFYDVVYFQNRRHNDTEANRRLLDEMVTKRDMMTDVERKMIFDVRMLRLYFENDYAWQDYSIKLFNDAERYLNYSGRVAFEYLRAVNEIVRNGMRQNVYPGPGLMQLFGNVLRKNEEYLDSYDKELIELPDDFLYRKKEMLMLKVDYLKAKANERMEYGDYLKAMSDTLHKIISLCEKSGDEREKLHFQVVLADEALAYRDDVSTIGKCDDEMMELAKVEATECIQEINQTLKRHHYERTLSYYIFYASYLNMKLDDKVMAKLMMERFQATGVNIKHYTLAVQELYEEVKTKLEK